MDPHHLLKTVTAYLANKPVFYRKGDTLSLVFDSCALQSEMNVNAPDELILEYTQVMIGFLLFHTSPQSIGMIGLGGGSLVKFCYRNLPKTAITVAEINPDVIALREHFHVPSDDKRLQVLCMDGADFVKQPSQCYDVIMVDGFDRSGQPAQLCSQCFYDACYRSLSAKGILVVNMVADTFATRRYVKRITRAFSGAVITTYAADCDNKIVFAAKGDALRLDDRALRRRACQLQSTRPLKLGPALQSILLARRALELPMPPHSSNIALERQ